MEIPHADISRIDIAKKGRHIEILRENDTWLAGDKKYPADSRMIDSMINGIADLRLTALASESKNYALYELDEDRRIEVRAFNGDRLLRTLMIGKPASSYRHTFVMLDSDHRVFHAEGGIRNTFDRKVSDLRDKAVMEISGDITEIVMQKDGTELVIVQAAAPVSVDVTEEDVQETAQEKAVPKWATADGREVKENEVDAIVRTMSNFLCDEFIEDRTKDDFTSPIFTITLKGMKSYTMSLFEKKDDKYPAVSSENSYPFLISEWKAKNIMKDFESLIEGGE